MTFNW